MNLVDFYGIIGGDYESLIKRLAKEESIKKYLKRFCNDAEYMGMIDGFEEQDWEKVFKCSHSLKGVCANLELTKLQQAVSDICESVRHGAPEQDITDLICKNK